MAEYDRYAYGPRIDSGAFQEKLYLLLCLFMASKAVTTHCDDEVDCQITALRDEFEELLISRLLIECAVAIRMKDDLFEQQHKMRSGADQDVVGEIREPEKAATSVPLTLREACNKIIHATHFRFDSQQDDGFHRRYLDPFVYLHGTRQKSNWTAKLDIVQWVELGASMFPR